MKILTFAVAWVCLVLCSSIVAAEEQAIEEIIVTAQKRSESVQEVAAAVSALGKNQIEDRGITTVADLQTSIPGLNYSENAGASMVTIRGIGMQVENGNAEPGVATHVDGFFLPRASMATLELLDLERIEVLRGPQGTLYGRNATGGVINYISAKPTQEFTGEITVGGGDWGATKMNGFVSGALVEDRLLGRLSASYSDHNGYLKNVGTGDRELGDDKQNTVRGALRWLPSDAVTVDLSISYQEQETSAVEQALEFNPESTFSIDGLITLPDDRPDSPHTVNQSAVDPRRDKETTLTGLTFDWAINETASFKSITGYIDHTEGPQIFAADGTTAQGVLIGIDGDPRIQESESLTQEFNLSGAGLNDRLDWVLGAYYFDEEFTSETPIYLAGLFASGGFFGEGPDINRTNVVEETESLAFFADVTYQLSDDWRINFGLRHSEDDKNTSQFGDFTINSPTLFALGFIPADPLVIPLCPDVETSQSWSSTDPKARLEWNASETVLFYAQYQEAYKSGGISFSTCAGEYEPEEIQSWEAALKMTLLDGSMILNLTAFNYDYENQQSFVTPAGGVGAIILNTDESRMRGVEVEWQWRVNDAFSIDTAIAYNDSEIEKAGLLLDSVAQINAELAGATRMDAVALGVVDIEGNPTQRAPELTASLGLNVDVPLSEAGDLTLRGEWYHQSETQYRLYDNDTDEGDAYNLINLYATYTTPSNNIAVRGFVKNATDEEYIIQIVHATSIGSIGNYGLPRHWGVEVSYRF